MLPTERREAVQRHLTVQGEAGFTELAEMFDVSEMTIRRDLELLEADGLVRRVRGGAISVVSRGYEPPLSVRAVTAAGAKEAIGRAAAALVNDGDTIILDVGTTTLALARALYGRHGLTVVTSSLPVAIELGPNPDIRVMVTGGQVRTDELSLTGGMAEDAFSMLNCDHAFIGVAGIRAEPGLTEYNPFDARVKRAAIRASRRVIALADASKLGRVAFTTIVPLSYVDVLVTDARPDHHEVAAIAAADVEVISTVEP